MSPRPDVSAERKAQILEAASTVFAKQGFHKARMDDIGAAAGLSKGALYLYFKSKDALITALLRLFFDPTIAELRKLEAVPTTATARLERITALIASEVARMSHLLPLAYEFYAVSMREQVVRDFLKDYYKEYRTLLQAIIQQGIDTHEFTDGDAADGALALSGLYEGLTLLWLLDPKAQSWGDMSARSLTVLLNGLKRKEG